MGTRRRPQQHCQELRLPAEITGWAREMRVTWRKGGFVSCSLSSISLLVSKGQAGACNLWGWRGWFLGRLEPRRLEVPPQQWMSPQLWAWVTHWEVFKGGEWRWGANQNCQPLPLLPSESKEPRQRRLSARPPLESSPHSPVWSFRARPAHWQGHCRLIWGKIVG